MPAIEPPLQITEAYIGDPNGLYTYAVESNRKHVYLCEINSEANALGRYDYQVICQTHKSDKLVASGAATTVKEAVDTAKDLAKSIIMNRR